MPPGIGYGRQQNAPSYGKSQQPGAPQQSRRLGPSPEVQASRGIGSYILPSSYELHPETGEPIMSPYAHSYRNRLTGAIEPNMDYPEVNEFAAELLRIYPTFSEELAQIVAYTALNLDTSLRPYAAAAVAHNIFLDPAWRTSGTGAVPLFGTPAYEKYVASNPQFFGGL